MAGSGSGGGWRGRQQTGQQATEAQHAWQQQTTTQQPVDAGRRGRVWYRLRIITYLGIFMGTLGVLLYFLLYSPVQTPVIMIAPEEYEWPLPPNAMAREDFLGLTDLARNGRGSLHVENISDTWRSKETGIQMLSSKLQAIAQSWKRRGPVVIYLSMHGVTDGQGRPHLLTPSSSPVEQSTWLSLEELLDTIKGDGSLASHPKLLVLDCAKMDRNWFVGKLHGSFTAGARTVIQQKKVPNLAVLTASDEGQQAFVSPSDNDTVFGRYLREGLAGKADTNEDSQVSIEELHTYVAAHTTEWAELNRGVAQNPQLIWSTQPSNFRISWRLRGELPSASAPAAKTASLQRKMADFWTAYHNWRSETKDSPLHPAALAWHRVEHRLLQLEQLFESGAAYEDQIRCSVTDMETLMRKMQLQEDEQNVALPAYWDALDELTPRLDLPETVHSLPLAEFFQINKLDPATRNAADQALLAVEQSPNIDTVKATVAQLNTLRESGKLPALVEAHLLHLIARYGLPDPEAPQAAVSIQLAVRNARLASQVTAPHDERVARWLEGPVAVADGHRRRAGDLTLLDSAEANAQWQNTENALAQVQTRRALIEEAYRLRDSAWAELPYLAFWFTRPLPHNVPSTNETETLSSKLWSVIRDTQVLGERLAVDEPSDDVAGEIENLVGQLRENRKWLLDRLNSDMQLLVDAQNADAGTMRDIQVAMQVPLITQEHRSQLRSMKQRFRVGTESSESTLAAAEEYGRRWTQDPWIEHPALALLVQAKLTEPAPPSDAAGVNVLDRQGKRLRDILRTLASQIDNQKPGESSAKRAGWSKGDRLLRPAGALTSLSLSENPTRELRKTDLHHLLLWHGQRALGDMFGPAAPGEPPLALTAARDYLDAASKFAMMRDPDNQYQTAINSVEAFGRQGVSLQAQHLLLPIGTSEVEIDAKGSRPFPAAGNGPQGFATVVIMDEAGTPVSARQQLPLPLGDQEAQIKLSSTSKSEGRPQLIASALFRGWDYGYKFFPDEIGGVRATFSPAEYRQASVKLHGDRSKRSSVVFVLDCSFSMREPLPGELQQGDSRSRMEIAKSKLLEMLSEMAREKETRVGVFFFGHRRAWERSENPTALTQDSYTGPIPENLQPGEDVEEVLSLGTFDPPMVEDLKERLRSVIAWGQTPLHLALVRAEEAFGPDDKETEKSIVVISDGRDYQYAPPNNPLGSVTSTSRNDVLAAYRKYGAKVHIISLELQDANVNEVIAQFNGLANETGGRHLKAQNASALLGHLRELTGPGEYQVLRPTGENAGVTEGGVRGPTTLENRLYIEPTPSPVATYRIVHDLVDERISIRAGDALALTVNELTDQIEAVPFDQQAVSRRLESPSRSTDFDVTFRVHGPIPVPNSDGVRFRVSMQDAQLRPVTARPEEVWLEITPLTQQGRQAGPTYTFYDRNYAANTPVPVLDWIAQKWPPQATAARVRFWTNPVASPIIGAVTLLDARKDPNATHPIPTVDGAKLVIATSRGPKRFRVDVIQEHPIPEDQEEADVTVVKVDLDTDPAVRPLEVIRQFDNKHGIAIHSFFFDPSVEGLLDTAAVVMRSRRAIQSNAWKLPGRAIEVDIADEGNTLSAPEGIGAGTRGGDNGSLELTAPK